MTFAKIEDELNWADAKGIGPIFSGEVVRYLLNSWAEAEARAMKAEFYRTHYSQYCSTQESVLALRPRPCQDIRRTWTDDRWREEALKKLREGK